MTYRLGGDRSINRAARREAGAGCVGPADEYGVGRGAVAKGLGNGLDAAVRGEQWGCVGAHG